MTDATTGARADAVELLTAQHRDVEQLWQRAQEARGAQHHDRAAELGQRVITMLSQHDAIETVFLYPAIRDVGPAGDQLADHGLEEHQQIRELLKEADDLLDASKPWASLDAAMRQVARHVVEEEGQLFPLLRTAGQERLAELGDAMSSAMKVAPTHPHPSTPDNPLAALAMGTASGIIDRVRDALKKHG